MFWLEGRVVSALAGDDDVRTGGAISRTTWRPSLAAMPQHLRLGVAVESLGLGVLGPAAPRPDPDDRRDPPVDRRLGAVPGRRGAASTRAC